MSWLQETLQRKFTRRETLELGGKAAVGLALAACAPVTEPRSQPDQSSSPAQKTAKVDVSSQYEVSATLKEDDLVKALKKHGKTAAEAIVFDGRLEKILPFFTSDTQNKINLDPQLGDSYRRALKPYTLCGNQGITLNEGSVSPIQNEGKAVSVLFSKTCNSSFEITVPSYPNPVTRSTPMTLTQITFYYQKVDGIKYKISAIQF